MNSMNFGESRFEKY